MNATRRVTILQHRLLQYRLSLFNRLRDRCAESGIELRLVHGQPSAHEAVRKDTGHLLWADEVKNRFLRVSGVDLIWQPLPSHLLQSDLLILMQENRILSNNPLLLRRRFGGPKVAYWGHGKNFQSRHSTGLREWWKSKLINKVDWWFAYTDLSKDIIKQAGFPIDQITVLNNAIDNDEFKQDLASVSEAELSVLRGRLDLQEGAHLGLFCGSMYPDKRIDFLLEAANRIHDILPGFRLALIGDGPEAPRLQTLLEGRPWAHWLGQQRGREKATAFHLASVILNPGLVGLHVLDGFCAGLPMFTTEDAAHSPEIAYLKSGINGFILPHDVAYYANEILNFLDSKSMQMEFKKECFLASEHYTIQNMVENFHSGIMHALNL